LPKVVGIDDDRNGIGQRSAFHPGSRQRVGWSELVKADLRETPSLLELPASRRPPDSLKLLPEVGIVLDGGAEPVRAVAIVNGPRPSNGIAEFKIDRRSVRPGPMTRNRKRARLEVREFNLRSRNDASELRAAIFEPSSRVHDVG
jgi:hypothetical protein